MKSVEKEEKTLICPLLKNKHKLTFENLPVWENRKKSWSYPNKIISSVVWYKKSSLMKQIWTFLDTFCAFAFSSCWCFCRGEFHEKAQRLLVAVV